MIELFAVNWLAIFVSTLVGYVIGGLWYSPVLFGNAWMQEHGYTPESLGSPTKAMSHTFVTSFVSAWVLAVIIKGMGVTGFMDGLTLGCLLGIGLMFATRYSDGLYNNQSLKLALIEGGYRAVYVATVVVILTLWT